MSIMYIFIGIRHFTGPQYFLDIVPPQLPSKLFLVYFTGLIEIVGGAAILSPKSRKEGAYLLIFLLISVFPANIYLYLSETPQNLLGISKTDALIRMPFQTPLILLAYWHSKKNHPKWGGLSFIAGFSANNNLFFVNITIQTHTSSCF